MRRVKKVCGTLCLVTVMPELTLTKILEDYSSQIDGASAASEGVSRVGPVENSCNYGGCGKVAYVLIRVDIGLPASMCVVKAYSFI